jgi:biopolymer transport protein ExbD
VRLPRRAAGRVEVPTTPFLGLALVSFACITPLVLWPDHGGVDLAFRATAPAETPSAGDVVWIRVLPDSGVLVDGEPGTIESLPERLSRKPLTAPGTLVVLDVREDAPYGAMIAAYDRLVSIDRDHGGPIGNLVIPSQREIREYIRRYGIDPAEAWSNPDRTEASVGRR